MDDSCAVCAESLEWVAYGACGHKDVCSNCVARLRFICDDRRCCICKTESNVVFVTKALGVYTNTISDFSVFPSNVKEGRVENYWYHEDTQSFFDDLDHYKMIKAMCRLSCGLCDKMEDRPDDGSRRRAEFRNIEQLKGHLFHKHRLMMCSLCLEGRKVFICEQKLYTRSQLTQHTNTGDSEVDGTESERGGFMGHPRCEFCGTPFYGDNELYTHMSTEHFICHICQRHHPGQYEYYKNYDDLEIHFRRDHFLCEDEDCLCKKFIVFQSEAELKRHNTLEHGGSMSRSKRSAALQIPTSFRYQRSEQDHRRGRGRTFQRDLSDNQHSLAIQASLETGNTAPFSTRAATDHGESADVETLVPASEFLATVSEPNSRYLQAVSHNSTGAALGEVSFPPLTVNPGSSQQNPHSDIQPKRTMAALLRHQSNHKGNAKASSSASTPSWPGSSRTFTQPEINSVHDWPSINGASGLASGPRQSKPVIKTGHASPGRSVSAQSRPSLVTDSSSTASLIPAKMLGSTSRIRHSLSASNLSERGSLESSSDDFSQVAVAQTGIPSSDQNLDKVKNVQTANKSLVEKIRSALGFDEEKFITFKEISGEFRQGSMDAETYLANVVQFGLSDLVPELASLLPNVQKQKALMEAFYVNLVEGAPRENGRNNGIRLKNSKDSKKGKGKSVDSGKSVTKNSLADKVISTVNELQSNYRALDEAVTVLSKDGYRSDRGKSKAVVDDSQLESSGPDESLKAKNDSFSVVESNPKSGTGDGKSKQKKKTSKFHRVRLGDGSVEALLDLKSASHDPDPSPNIKDSAISSGPNMESLPARGVWRNGGGQKLLITSREPKK